LSLLGADRRRVNPRHEGAQTPVVISMRSLRFRSGRLRRLRSAHNDIFRFPARPHVGGLLSAALIVTSLGVDASEIESIQVSYSKPRYEVDAQMILDAPAASVYAVLSDYEGLSRLDDQIQSSEILERPEPGMAVVLVRLRGCLAFFCRSLNKVQRIYQKDGRQLTARVIADKSDFHQAFEQWVIDEEGRDRTRLSYRLKMELKEPPPLLFRNAMMKRRLRKTTLNVIDNLEQLAREETR